MHEDQGPTARSTTSQRRVGVPYHGADAAGEETQVEDSDQRPRAIELLQREPKDQEHQGIPELKSNEKSSGSPRLMAKWERLEWVYW